MSVRVFHGGMSVKITGWNRKPVTRWENVYVCVFVYLRVCVYVTVHLFIEAPWEQSVITVLW